MGLGRTAAGVAVVVVALVHKSFAAESDDQRHLHFDYQSNCAVYDFEPRAALSATWSGDCVQGLASGRGTAVFVRADHTQKTVSATYQNGRVQDGTASVMWSDGAYFEGTIASGMPDGAGVLTCANGDRFEGSWKHGALNGHGSIAWASGDRYDGEFADGRAEGHGIQVWANGDRYDGNWHNSLPSGAGSVTPKGGSTIAARFVDGKLQTPAPTHPAPARLASAPPANQASSESFLSTLSGSSLSALDGTSVRFEPADGGVVRTITAADGHGDKATFKLLNENLGTISTGDASRVIGFFRVIDSSLTAEYSDGRVEHLAFIAGGGLAGFFQSASGEVACMSWYPTGHVFSVDERKAAVSAYAQRLGVSPPATAKASQHCPSQPRVASSPAPTAKLLHPVLKQASTISTLPPYKLGEGPANLQVVPVRQSIVHPIDQSVVTSTVPSGIEPTADETIASKCLKVDSDGTYWGFRNHCSYSVQFAYCLLRDDTAPCGERGEGSASGSAAGNGFSALFADTSLTGGASEHDFRWVACRGGAGEVEVRLDAVEPASGRCLQRSHPHQQQASN